jgi:hypothetical protein
METRLNLTNETVDQIGDAEREGSGANDHDDLMKPTHLKAKYAKVDRLVSILKLLQAQLKAAATEETPVQVAKKETTTVIVRDGCSFCERRIKIQQQTGLDTAASSQPHQLW